MDRPETPSSYLWPEDEDAPPAKRGPIPILSFTSDEASCAAQEKTTS